MTTTEGFDSLFHKATPLSAVWRSVLGSAAEGLIDFLQTLNDEFDTQPERTHKTATPHGSHDAP